MRLADDSTPRAIDFDIMKLKTFIKNIQNVTIYAKYSS